MPMPRLALLALTSLTLVSLLTACGGGGDAPPAAAAVAADPADRFVGNWQTACGGSFFLSSSPTIARSARQQVTIKKVSASSYSLEGGSVDYVGSGCPGAGTPVVGETLTTVFTLAGTKSASGKTVDKVTYPTNPAGTTLGNDIVLVEGSNLQRGNTGIAAEADGFPGTLFPQVFIKQ